MSIVNNVRIACANKGTNIFSLESSLNFPRGSIYKWDTHVPSIGKVVLVADALGVSLDSLVDGVEYVAKEGQRHVDQD